MSVTPKHQRISLTPALPSRTVSSVTATHQEKHDISTTALFFGNWPASEHHWTSMSYFTTPNLKISIIQKIQKKIHLPPLYTTTKNKTNTHTQKKNIIIIIIIIITSKGHSWHLTTRWPFCISSLEVPPLHIESCSTWKLTLTVAWRQVLRIKMESNVGNTNCFKDTKVVSKCLKVLMFNDVSAPKIDPLSSTLPFFWSWMPSRHILPDKKPSLRAFTRSSTEGGGHGHVGCSGNGTSHQT